jgi:hypothetical protein
MMSKHTTDTANGSAHRANTEGVFACRIVMGNLAFYLEALDRDRKRSHENPSIGVLLCRTKDDEVVE